MEFDWEEDDDTPIVVPERNTPEWDALVLSCDPFDGDFGEPGDKTFTDKMAIVRKSGECHDCADEIPKGMRVRRRVDASEGQIQTFRWCQECCHAMASTDADGGVLSGERVALGMARRATQ